MISPSLCGVRSIISQNYWVIGAILSSKTSFAGMANSFPLLHWGSSVKPKDIGCKSPLFSPFCHRMPDDGEKEVADTILSLLLYFGRTLNNILIAIQSPIQIYLVAIFPISNL